MGKKQSLNFNPAEFQVISEPSSTAFDPNEFQVLSTPSPTKQVFEQTTPVIEPTKPNVDEILANLKTNNDSEKQIIKNIAIAERDGKATSEDLKNAMQTFQGIHPNQEGGKRYYMTEENGLYKPVPLGKLEQPPKDKNVAKVFEDSSWYEDLGNSVAAGAEKLGASLLRTPAFLTDVVGETSNTVLGAVGLPTVADAAKKAGLKGKPSDQVNRALGLDPDNSWADALEAQAKEQKSQIEQKYDQGITDYISQGEYGKAVGALGNAVAESLPVTISLMAGNAAGLTGTATTLLGGAVFGAEKKQELEGENLTENKKNAISLGYGLAEGFFEQFGITKLGSITKEVLKKEGKDAAKVFAENAFKEVYGKPLVNLVGTLGEEAAGEAATQFAQNAIDKYSGYNPDKDLFEGVADAALIGLGAASVIGGAAKSLEGKKDRELAKHNEQSQVAFDISQKGTDAINAFKADIDNSVKSGEIRPEKANEAKAMVDLFAQYHEQVSDLPLDDISKRKVFDFTLTKSKIEDQIKGLDPDKMNGIERAKYEGLKTQAKHLQMDIDKIVLQAQIKEETTVSDTTIDKQTKLAIEPDKDAKKEKKEGEKELPDYLKSLTDKYKSEPTKKGEDTRTYLETPKGEFNHKNAIQRTKFAKLANHLESLPDKVMEAKIVKREYPDNGKVNRVFEIEFKDGKQIRFASSKELETGLSSHFRIEHTNGRPEELPIGVKVEYLPSGKKVIKAFNAQTGKFLGYAKETLKGKSEYDAKDTDQLEHIGTIIEQPLLPPDKGEGNIEPVSPVTPKTPLQPFDNNNVQTNNEKETTKREGLASSDTEEIAPKSEVKHRRLVTGTKKANRKIRHPEKKAALKHEIFTPHGLAMQYFIGGGEINPDSIRKLFRGSNAEVRARISYVRKGANTLEQIAEKIVAEHDGIELDYNDVLNAVEEVVMENNSSTSMAKKLNKSMSESEQRFAPLDEVINDESEIADTKGYAEEFDKAMDILDNLSEDELTALANQQDEFNSWYQENENKIEESGDDIITNDDIDTPFQKAKQKASLEIEDHKIAERVTKYIQSVLPKVQVKYDTKIVDKEGKPISGKLNGNVISINPFYAGKDTPIHEAGHILIDAKGYESQLIQDGIAQLKNTDLWKETEKRYKELSEEMLGKEVLAEAIGREGADIFDTEVAKNKFQKFLDKILDWFKDKLGLEKNIAKKLAKQILRGEAKELTGTNDKEQFQKPKGNDFNNFREKQLGRNLIEEQEHLDQLEEALNDTEYSAEQKQSLQNAKDAILDRIDDDKAKYANAKEITDELHNIVDSEDLSDFTLEDLVRAYNGAVDSEGYVDYNLQAKAKDKIAHYVTTARNKQVEELHKGWIEKNVHKKDLTSGKFGEVWFKTLGHISANFPGVQGLYTAFNEKFLKMQQERNQLNEENNRLAKAVVKDQSKGIVGTLSKKAADLSKGKIPTSPEYFEYLSDKNGKLRDINDTKGLSKAQIEYLEFQHKLAELRGDVRNEEGELVENEIFKTDKGFAEAFNEDGLLRAVSNYMGGDSNLDTPVKNPITGKLDTYLNAQKAVIDATKAKGTKWANAKALGSLLNLSYQAKKSAAKSENTESYNGQLSTKASKQKDDRLGYSKNYYAASQAFINDYTHVKWMNQVQPIFDSILEFYKKLEIPVKIGEGQNQVTITQKFPNMVKFIENEMNDKIYQRKTVSASPISDVVLRALRGLVSKTVMAFNFKANLMNGFMGLYNNWREEGLRHVVRGHKRLLIGKREISPESGYMAISQKAAGLVKHFNVLNVDTASTPEINDSGWFAKAAYGVNKLAEYEVQASQFLGYLTKEEWNSFEYKDGVFILKKGVDPKAFDEKMNQYKDQVSDIQGKYNPKDMRNFMRGELGKNISSYKVWIPDYIRSRFGKEMILPSGKMVRGSWRMFTENAMKEIAADFHLDNNGNFLPKKVVKGTYNVLFNKKAKNKQIIRNLRGLAALAAIEVLMHSGDDNDDKRKQHQFETLSLENAVGNILFIFDPDADVYLIEHPVAVAGPVSSLFKAISAAKKGDSKKVKKEGKKLIPYRHLWDIWPGDGKKK